MDYIKPEDLKDGYLYGILARNAKIGIWWEEKGAFMISRFKFGNNYCFEEYHWDLSDSFGTVKPIEEIEKSPFDPEVDFKLMDKVNIEGIKGWGYNKEAEVLEYLNGKEEGKRGDRDR